MLLVGVMAAVLWGIGAALGTPRRLRWGMIAGLWAGVVLAHFVLPAGHPLRMATGESPALWLMIGGAVAIGLVYRQGLRRLRARSVRGETPPNAAKPLFSETELGRYARHIVLREIGGPGQKSLKQARVLVIGAGGLGSPALLYLAAAGVGTIGVIDDDTVDNSNLQRQVIHRDADIGLPKVQSAMAAMQAQNPHVVVRPYQRRLTPEIAADLFADYDLILDGTDNFTTRYLANAAAVKTSKPLISGALSQWEGQLSVFDPANGTPCYQCIFPEAPAPGLAPSCSEAGVLGPLPGVVGAMMAAEAIKVITGAGQALRGEMLIYDALYGESRKIGLSRRENCPICGGRGEKNDQHVAG
ncbi:putative Molybdopterin biosynthesis protein MoeB [Roseovarius sp. EC-HK134]|uniref:HesA/MoeB/ThiF family protein n=1 Tax=Roseovarius TaxID=74030 RepID=UPI00125BE03A|nr:MULTISPECIES: HesA/MoeB/ThiF family protein [Roseovarius]MBW4973551.1 HesA/MoeB/ThiF family protein [Roseovarius mucosus]VVS97305.1 putative Molybdopterin biosynthesis protein MoeB [Roseovarius sp. EC-HK134]VVS99534.1 putative Molybdopterin biosynthesis protein MoeB [Roseovarius sp. EC-SD190]